MKAELSKVLCKYQIGCVLLLFTNSLSTQPRLDHAYSELGILSYPSTGKKEVIIAGEIQRMDDVKVIQPIKKVREKLTRYQISPNKTEEIEGKKGFKIRFPEDTFIFPDGNPVKEKVDIEIREMLDTVDYATSELGLKYFDKHGRDYYLESAGIFEIKASSAGQEVIIKPDKYIYVDMPNQYKEKSFRLFKMNKEGNWEEYSANQPAPKNPRMSDKEYITLYIDKLGIYSRAEFRNNIACLKGIIEMPDNKIGKEIQIFSLGLNYGAYFTVWIQGNQFEINTFQSSKVRILVIDDKGNIGLSDIIQTPNKPGNARKPEGPSNFKMDIGTIKIKKADPSIFKDKQKLMEIIEQ